MLSLQEGQLFDGQYELHRLIDAGGFAEVWEAKYMVAGNTVALKIYPRLDEEGIRNIESEYKKLFELQHSNLLSVLHFGRFNGYPYLVMRYYPGGNGSRKIGDCSEQEIAKCLQQIGGVLKYLHANDFVHQDVKPNNFLLDQYGNYYLADLGLSLKVRNTIKMYTQSVNKTNDIASIQSGITPPPYRAPELYDRQRVSTEPVKATDIWAFGASLYEMITGEPPFGDLGGLMQMNDPIVKDLPPQYSRGLNDILQSCLDKETWQRPTAAQLEKMANYYIENGAWPVVKKNDGNGDGGNDGGGGKKDEDVQKKKRMNPLLIAVITIIGMIIGVFAIKNLIKPSGPVFVPTSDTTGTAKRRSDSLAALTNQRSIIDSYVRQIADTPIKKDPIIKDPIVSKDPPIVRQPVHPKEEAGIISYPAVREKPKSSCAPEITKIVRATTGLRVFFHLPKCDAKVSLYAPGSEQSFYIRNRATGKTYELVSISRSGEGIQVPDEGLSFTAVFEPINDDIQEIDLMEGKNQLALGMNFYNYKGIRLTK